MARPLTHKQTLFIAYYLGDADGNATEAAAMAGYKGNRRTLEVVGHENLSKPEIKKAITLSQQEMMVKVGVNRENIQKRYDQTFEHAARLDHTQTMKSALDSMCRLHGLNEERDDKNAVAPVNIQINTGGR